MDEKRKSAIIKQLNLDSQLIDLLKLDTMKQIPQVAPDHVDGQKIEIWAVQSGTYIILAILWIEAKNKLPICSEIIVQDLLPF